jgi:hypothetical protein
MTGENTITKPMQYFSAKNISENSYYLNTSTMLVGDCTNEWKSDKGCCTQNVSSCGT